MDSLCFFTDSSDLGLVGSQKVGAICIYMPFAMLGRNGVSVWPESVKKHKGFNTFCDFHVFARNPLNHYPIWPETQKHLKPLQTFTFCKGFLNLLSREKQPLLSPTCPVRYGSTHGQIEKKMAVMDHSLLTHGHDGKYDSE